MVAQTATMSHPTSSQTTERSGLFRKLVLLFLLVAAFAFGLLILFREQPGYPGWFQNWFAVVSLAVVAGFGSRWVLSRRSGFVRILAATAAYISGLFLLGLISKWKYGIGPIEFWLERIDVDGLTQVGVGLCIFLLVFLAWRKRAPNKTRTAATPPSAAPPNPAVEARPATPARTPRARPAIKPERKSILDLLKPAQKPVKINRKGGASVRKAVRTMTEADLPVRPRKRSIWRGRPKVQIALVEEHRCPYCLENVSRTDPRGVVECEVCHTLHHKDCWEITGVCQVPHYNS